MRKVLDFLLLLALGAGLVFGAYELGHAVIRTGREAAQQSSESTSPTTTGTTATTSSSHRNTRHLQILVGLAIAALIVLMVFVSVVKSLFRSRRRRWQVHR